MTKAEQKKAVQFTRMCKFWRTNECKMGTDCTFAHTTEELRPSPKPCFDFVKKGICSRGQACRFVHDLNGIKPKAKMEVQYALENFQPCAVPSQLLATYMLPQSPMNVEGWLEPQYAYTPAPWPATSTSEDRLSSSYWVLVEGLKGTIFRYVYIRLLTIDPYLSNVNLRTQAMHHPGWTRSLCPRASLMIQSSWRTSCWVLEYHTSLQ